MYFVRFLAAGGVSLCLSALFVFACGDMKEDRESDAKREEENKKSLADQWAKILVGPQPSFQSTPNAEPAPVEQPKVEKTNPQGNVVNAPDFVKVRAAACAEYNQATNPVKRTDIVDSLKKTYLRTKFKAQGLRGVVEDISTELGYGTFSVRTDFGLFSNNDMVLRGMLMNDNTVSISRAMKMDRSFDKGSKLYRKLAEVNVGDTVAFSGTDIFPDIVVSDETLIPCGDRWVIKFSDFGKP